MFKEKFRDKLKAFIIPTLVFIAIFLLWEWWAINSAFPVSLRPQPSEIIYELFTKINLFLEHLKVTMLAAVTGFFIAAALSFVTATLFVYSKKIEYGFYPYIIALRIAPAVSLAPFVILWLGTGISSKIAIVVLICFFPMLVNMIAGLKRVDNDALDLFKSFSASKAQVFYKLRFPNSLPFIFPALKISSALAIIGAFVGEFIAANQGIGYLILLEQTRLLNTNTAFAALFITILAGILFFLLIGAIEKKIVFWQKYEGL